MVQTNPGPMQLIPGEKETSQVEAIKSAHKNYFRE